MSPAQGRETVMEAGFDCNILWSAEGTSYFQVKIPSTNQQYSVAIDEEFRADCTETVNELIEAVTQDALAIEECVCEHDKSLRNHETETFDGKKAIEVMGGDTTWIGCGHCSRCPKCKRRISRYKFDSHSWWCGYPENRFKPVFIPPAKRLVNGRKPPAPVQMGLF